MAMLSIVFYTRIPVDVFVSPITVTPPRGMSMPVVITVTNITNTPVYDVGIEACWDEAIGDDLRLEVSGFGIGMGVIGKYFQCFLFSVDHVNGHSTREYKALVDGTALERRATVSFRVTRWYPSHQTLIIKTKRKFSEGWPKTLDEFNPKTRNP
jgi:hypothetical protein